MPIDPTLLVGDVVASAQSRLLTAVTDAGLIPSQIGQDSTGQAFASGWVFTGLGENGAPFRDVNRTGKAAVVLMSRDEWASNNHNTARFPILQVLIYADSSRDAAGNIAARDSELRCQAIAKVVRKTFHDPANEVHEWPFGLRVHSSVVRGGLGIDDVPGSEGVVRGSLRVELSVD